MSDSNPTAKELHAAFKKIHSIGKATKGVFISNGFLVQCEKNKELQTLLSDEETEYLKLSTGEYNSSIRQRQAANKEHTATIASLESAKESLEKEKNVANFARIEAEKAKAEAEQSRAEALDLANELEKDRNELKSELEQTFMLQLQSDRMRHQFKTFGLNSPWAWALLFLFLVGILVLLFYDKDGVDVLVPVLAAVLGTYYGAMGLAMGSLYTPIMREEKGSPAGKREPREESPEP